MSVGPILAFTASSITWLELTDPWSFSPHSAVTNFIDEKLVLNTEEGQVDVARAAFKATTAEA